MDNQQEQIKKQRIIDEANRCALLDIANYIWYGHSVNPYSTVGVRYDWQRGFEDLPLRSWERTFDYCTAYQRGKAAARILKEMGLFY